LADVKLIGVERLELPEVETAAKQLIENKKVSKL
jgi:hypothetical protein